MVRHPAAFLMDEPLSNLDAKLRVHMRAEIAELHRRLGATFIYVTHDQVEAMTMSDRVAMMEGGRVLQLGTPPSSTTRPGQPRGRALHRQPDASTVLPGASARTAGSRCSAAASASPSALPERQRGDRRDPARGARGSQRRARRRPPSAARGAAAPDRESRLGVPPATSTSPTPRASASSPARPIRRPAGPRLDGRRLAHLRARRRIAHVFAADGTPQSSAGDARMIAARRARRQAFIERLRRHGLRAAGAAASCSCSDLVPARRPRLLSLTDYQFGALDLRFVGLDNFAAALDDPVFRRSLVNTFLYVAIVVPGSVAFGLLLAILVHGRGPQPRPSTRSSIFLPVTATLIAMASVWKFLLHPTLGPVNAVLVMLGFQPVNFLSDPACALPTLAVIGIWQLVGFNMVLFLAGLSTIPQDLYEAADMDGAAGAIDRFLTVTWPMLGPTTMFVLITTSITAFKVFDTVVAMTRGAPQGRPRYPLRDVPGRLPVSSTPPTPRR